MKGRICAVICAIMIVALFVGLCIYEQYKTEKAYLEAVECLKDGKYDKAMMLLEKANKKNFDETDFSYRYCLLIDVIFICKISNLCLITYFTHSYL